MFRKKIFSILVNLTPVAFFACAQGPGNPMGGGDQMMGYSCGGGFMWLIFLILVGAGIYSLFKISKSKGSSGSINETPLDTLKKRYAKGEIDKDEFDQKKKDLES
jgi:putative membrane protein